jgi:diguanylate cyclase (GGDEF)-like protein
VPPPARRAPPPERRQQRRRRVQRAVAPGLLILTLVAVYQALSPGPGKPAVEVVIFALAAYSVHQGVLRHRPTTVAAWNAVLAALAAFAVSSAAETAMLARVAAVPAGVLEPVLDLVGYAALAVAGLVVLVHDRRWREPEGWLDGVTFVLAGWLSGAAWGEAVGTAGGLYGERAVGFAVLTAIVLVSGARLALPGQGRSVSGLALCVAALLTVTGYAAELVGPSTEPQWLWQVLPLCGVAALAVAANHPSMARLGLPAVGDRALASRLVGIGAALLVNPVLVLVWSLRQHVTGYALAAGVAVLTAIALFRIGRLAVEREQDRRALEESEARLRLQAATDALTGLANRSDFLDRVAVALEGTGGDSLPALLFVDLDGFKSVNDTLGHAAGDDLLVAVAGRLRACVRDEDAVARLGGDEFAVLLLDSAAGRAVDIAGRIIAALREPFVLDGGRTAVVTGSVGGVHAQPGDTAGTLLHKADGAMYDVKRAGKDAFELLGPG